jgi:hypothetical protein
LDSEAFFVGNRTNFEHVILLTQLAGDQNENKFSLMALLELKQLLRANYKEFLAIQTEQSSLQLNKLRNIITWQFVTLTNSKKEKFYFDIIKIFIHPENLPYWNSLFSVLG